jgi:hypothetical protein
LGDFSRSGKKKNHFQKVWNLNVGFRPGSAKTNSGTAAFKLFIHGEWVWTEEWMTRRDCDSSIRKYTSGLLKPQGVLWCLGGGITRGDAGIALAF